MPCPRCDGEGCIWCKTRKGSPDTSYVAAGKIVEQLPKLQQQVLDLFKAHGRLTQDEVHELGCETYGERAYASYRARVGELETKGLLQKAGKQTIRDRVCTVYELVDQS